MANNENLIPPKKGEIRNPNGRPKGLKNRQTLVREMLEKAAVKKFKGAQDEAFGEDVGVNTIQEQIIASLVLKAIGGDVAATKELLDSDYKKMESVEVKMVGDSGKEEAASLDFNVGGEALHDKIEAE